MDDTLRTWLVERTFSDDEQNLIILVYATPDGEQYLRKERAVTSFTGAALQSTLNEWNTSLEQLRTHCSFKYF
jgi:predicted transcriptional regulator